MNERYEYCPKCDKVCATSRSIAFIKRQDEQGNEAYALVFHYHCESCLSYIRSEDVESKKAVSTK